VISSLEGYDEINAKFGLWKEDMLGEFRGETLWKANTSKTAKEMGKH
jgi:hypothetical protein